MNAISRKFAFLALISALILSCTPVKKPLRLATYTYATNNRIANLQPLADELERQLGQPVEVYSYPDVAAFLKGIQANEVDIALLNTLGYLTLSLDNPYMLPVAKLKVKSNAVDNYRTVLVSNDPAIHNLNTLIANQDTLSLMLVAKGSTSGHLVPRLMLSSLGISTPEEQFESVSYGGNHTATFQKLIAGEVDVCAFGSNEYFSQMASDTSLKSKTHLVWISEEIPLGPVLLNKRLSKKAKNKISSLLLALHDTHPKVLSAIKAGWSEAKQAEKFHTITDSYYDDFRSVNGHTTDLANILNLYAD